jgi:hypothetical protein
MLHDHIHDLRRAGMREGAHEAVEFSVSALGLLSPWQILPFEN